MRSLFRRDINQHVGSWWRWLWILRNSERMGVELDSINLPSEIIPKNLLLISLGNFLVIEPIPELFDFDVSIIVSGLSFKPFMYKHSIKLIINSLTFFSTIFPKIDDFRVLKFVQNFLILACQGVELKTFQLDHYYRG